MRALIYEPAARTDVGLFHAVAAEQGIVAAVGGGTDWFRGRQRNLGRPTVRFEAARRDQGNCSRDQPRWEPSKTLVHL